MNMIASFYFALQVCPNLTLMHLQRWHDTVIHQPRFAAVYHPEAFKEALISHKDQSTKKKQQPNAAKEPFMNNVACSIYYFWIFSLFSSTLIHSTLELK